MQIYGAHADRGGGQNTPRTGQGDDGDVRLLGFTNPRRYA